MSSSSTASRVILCVSLASVICSPAFLAPSLAQQAKDRKTLLFVGDVLTKTEYAVVGGNRVVRWEEPPTLSVFGDQNRHPAIVGATVREINRAMPENLKLEHLPDEDEDATIKLYFIKFESFQKIADQHGFQPVEGNRGFFFLRWDEKMALQESIVLIAEDELKGKRLRHFVLEEVAQSLGLGGDSKHFPKSIFYEDNLLLRYGTATRLTPIDRKLIAFLYQHVPTGAEAVEVGQLFEKHW